ncbi:MAG: AMP-binding protein [Actinomycetes bacterium]
MPDHDVARDDYLDGWARVAGSLTWTTPFTEVLRERPPYHDWFVGGRTNLALNCLDRHLDAGAGGRTAVLWEGEPGDRRELTYRELHEQTVRLAAALRTMGVGPGDRVALHLGWLPETVVALLAALRVGAEVTVIPVALPGEALALRLEAYAPRILFTQDGGWRHGAILPLKARADDALEATTGVQHTVVVRRTGVHVDWFEGDLWYDEVLDGADPVLGAAEPLASDATAVVAHLANRRGRPVAVRHGTGNLAVAALAVFEHGLADGDVFWCAGDVSWLGAQAHGVVGPLLAGACAVMYEGTLDVPDPARTWRLVERYQVSSLMTSPSIVRALRGWSLTAPAESTASLRRVTTIGERLDPDLRSWLRTALGSGVTLADGWGQLELAGIVTLDRPVHPDLLPDPGFAVVDQDGTEVPDGEAGQWVMLWPWPGTLRGVVAARDTDPTAYHWSSLPGRYASGDLARRLPDGQVEFLGRLDEVVSISGQLVSLNEVADALREQPFVQDAEVFERFDPTVGRSVAAGIVLAPDAPADDVTLRDLQDGVRDLLGGLSRPRSLVVVDRFGEELSPAARRAALAALATGHTGVLRVTWEQVLAAAGR